MDFAVFLPPNPHFPGPSLSHSLLFQITLADEPDRACAVHPPPPSMPPGHPSPPSVTPSATHPQYTQTPISTPPQPSRHPIRQATPDAAVSSIPSLPQPPFMAERGGGVGVTKDAIIMSLYPPIRPLPHERERRQERGVAGMAKEIKKTGPLNRGRFYAHRFRRRRHGKGEENGGDFSFTQREEQGMMQTHPAPFLLPPILAYFVF